MIKENIKTAILTGIVGGITAAITFIILLFAYIKFDNWYKNYEHEQLMNKGEATHCSRQGTKELVDSCRKVHNYGE